MEWLMELFLAKVQDLKISGSPENGQIVCATASTNEMKIKKWSGNNVLSIMDLKLTLKEIVSREAKGNWQTEKQLSVDFASGLIVAGSF